MKKRFGRIFNAILILAITLALCPAVQTMAEEDVSAYIMDGTVITGYTGAGGDITLPAVATEVADYAFAGNASIVSVTIPANITRVGNYSFSGCSGLSSAVFAGTASVGAGAFYGCSSLPQSHPSLPEAPHIPEKNIHRRRLLQGLWYPGIPRWSTRYSRKNYNFPRW